MMLAGHGFATVFGNVRGVVHDPQHHPLSGAHATLQANDSAFKLMAVTGDDGQFHFDAVPLGKYTVTAEADGFSSESQVLVVVSGSAPVLHYQLAVATAKEEVTVTASAGGPESGFASAGHPHQPGTDLALRGS